MRTPKLDKLLEQDEVLAEEFAIKMRSVIVEVKTALEWEIVQHLKRQAAYSLEIGRLNADVDEMESILMAWQQNSRQHPRPGFVSSLRQLFKRSADPQQTDVRGAANAKPPTTS